MFPKNAFIFLSLQIFSCFADELVATVMVFRHGARVPRLFHPNDPYKNMSYWPVPVGESTEVCLNSSTSSKTNQTALYSLCDCWTQESKKFYHISNSSVPLDALIICFDTNGYNTAFMHVICFICSILKEGEQMAYELGRWARQRYQHFLPGKYASKDFFMYSSGKDRTLISAALFAQGLYPPRPPYNPPCQAIPIHSKPPHMDNTIFTEQPCPTRDYLLEKIMNTDFFKRIAQENEDVYRYLSTHMGMSIKNFKGLSTYYDTFFIEEKHNLTLPEWTKKVYPDKLLELALYNHKVRTFDTESTRLRIGSLFSEILAYFTSFSSSKIEFGSDFKRGNRGSKMMAISGHDINIGDILSVLKFPVDVWPSCSSSVIFELMKKSNSNLIVNAFFKNSTGIHHVDSMGCGLECELNNFVDYVKPIVMDPKDWKKECILDEKHSQVP